jgi:Mg2+ and Co2+ transporters
MLTKYSLHEGKVVEAVDGDGPIWLCVAPDESERRFLVENLKLDEHTLHSSLDPDEQPRLEFEPAHIALIFKRPKNYSAADQYLFRVTSVGVFLFKDRVVIVTPDDAPLFEGRQLIKIATPLDLMLKLIYRSIYHYFEHLKTINMITDALEQKINTAMENKYLLNLFSLGKSLVFYVNALDANAMLIEKLKTNTSKIGFTREQLEFIDDLLIENKQCLKQAEIYSNILASLMDARASIVSNNLNNLMKTLNIITIGIMVPTLVVSIFSMNVVLPLSQDHPFTFWIVIGLSLVSVVTFLFVWNRRKWH